MPKRLERKLKQVAASKGYTGRRADNFVYGIMNKEGFMHGNKPTGKKLKPKSKRKR